MSNVYEEIEVEVATGQGKTEKYSFPKTVIQYYRQYTTSPTEGKGSFKTMLYLQGSLKGLVLECGYDTFKKKLGARTVDVSGLDDEDVEKVLTLVAELKKHRDIAKGA